MGRLASFLVLWMKRLVCAVAVAYPLCLIAAIAAMRYVGESWWVTAVALYLPRYPLALPLPFVALALLLLRKRRLLALQALSAIILVIPLMSFVLPLPTFAGRGGPTMRVLSFNVNSGRSGVEEVVHEIEHYSPDIAVLQETGGRRDELARVLSDRYPTVVTYSQFVLATRYPLASTDDPGAPGAEFQRQLLETPFGRVALYNVHTLSPRAPLASLRGRSGALREVASGRIFHGPGRAQIVANAQLRASEVQSFAEEASRETVPVIIAGDTNLPTLSPILRSLSGYQDGFESAGWGFGYTFPADKWHPWMRIDRILASRALRFVDFEVGETAASDHLCVVADLKPR